MITIKYQLPYMPNLGYSPMAYAFIKELKKEIAVIDYRFSASLGHIEIDVKDEEDVIYFKLKYEL